VTDKLEQLQKWKNLRSQIVIFALNNLIEQPPKTKKIGFNTSD